MKARPAPPVTDTRRLAVFLDVDGTLLALRDTPDEVRSDTALRVRLARLATRTDGALALISGRTLTEIDRIFAPLQLSAAGTHGGEIRHAGTDLSPPSLTRLDAKALAPLEALVAANEGLLLENKGVSVSVHYRLRPEFETECRAAMETLHALDPDSTRLLAGNKVFELTPRSANKGAAINRLLGEAPFRGRQPVFVGDDTTDEAGFAAVNAKDGISVRVAHADTTEARFGLANVAAVHTWLDALLDGAG